MRKFCVVGCGTNKSNDLGEVIAFTSNRSEAMLIAKEQGGFVRKEVFELVIPAYRRRFQGVDLQQETKSLNKDSESPGCNHSQDSPILSNGARKLVEEFSLTAEDLAEIKPTGTTGNIVKEDVETYLESLT